jgi:hypothetical protein
VYHRRGRITARSNNHSPFAPLKNNSTMEDENGAAHMPSRQEENSTEDGSTGEVVGSAALRPVFLGNLISNYSTDQVTRMFEHPAELRMAGDYKPVPVDRIDVKRGYCFVFLKDAESQKDKERIEDFIRAINGM